MTHSTLTAIFLVAVLTATVLLSDAPVSALPTARQMTIFRKRKAACMARPKLVCTVEPTEGSTVSGSVIFTPAFRFASNRGRRGYHICYVRIRATVTGLAPSSEHGFHIHTYGDVRGTDGTSTGGHFSNPAGDAIAHGFPTSTERHMGDLGNLVADDSGVANYERFDDVIAIDNVLGRGVTIHALSDKGPDFQPTGDAGSRVATCVIGYANPAL